MQNIAKVVNGSTCQNKPDDKIWTFKKVNNSTRSNTKLSLKVELILVWGGGKPLVSDTIALKSFHSEKNIPLRFVHIKWLFIEWGQNEHELFFSVSIFSRFMLGFFSYYYLLGGD